MTSVDLTWYFAFTEGNRSTFWSKVTRTGFSHVVIFAQTGITSTSIEALKTGVIITNHDTGTGMGADDLAQLFIQSGFKVVRHTFSVYDDRSVMHLGNLWPSCVSLAKIITGYRSWAWTPYQLYRSLLLDGATIIEQV